jgi:DNA-binding GntR family transcriptional regulator
MQAQIRMFLTVNTQLYEDLVTIAVSDHQQIVDAIRLRDGAEAARLMKHHIEFAVQQTRAFFQRKRVVEAEQVQLAVETSSRGRNAT